MGHLGLGGVPSTDPQYSEVFRNNHQEFAIVRAFSIANVAGGSGIVTFDIRNADSETGEDPIFYSIYPESLNCRVNDGANQYLFYDPTLSSDKKTLTVHVKKNAVVNLLSGALAWADAPNGTTVFLDISGDFQP